MKRESFIFYKSFYNSIKELDPIDQAQIYNAIFEYQFEGKETELRGICKSIFTLIIPQLEANNKRYINGCKGGAPKGNQNATKKQPKTTKKQPNDNVNVNDNDNVNVFISNTTNNIYDFLEQNFNRTISPLEVTKIDNWLKEYDEDIIKYAIEKSVMSNAKTFNYINGILNNWKSVGYKTLKEIKENEKTRKETNIEKKELFDYDWLNESEE